MKRTVKLLNLILAAAILLSACAQAAKPTPAPQAAAVTKIPAQPTATTAAAIPTKAPQQVQVTEADQGKNFMLSPGDFLIVVLDSNPSTGYTWVVKPVDNPVLAQAGEPVFKADSEKLGASGKTTFTLKVSRCRFPGAYPALPAFFRKGYPTRQDFHRQCDRIEFGFYATDLCNPKSRRQILHGPGLQE